MSKHAQLHITHGGYKEMADRKFLIKAAKRKNSRGWWTVPKSAQVGDDVLIVVAGAIFASARVASEPWPPPHRRDDGFPTQYRASIDQIELRTRIPICEIKEKLPSLKWAKYPRSYTTLSDKHARQMRALIERVERPQ
jgi:hypothetical protein